MREPVTIAPEPMPAPAQSLMPRKGLKEPDQQFLDGLGKCIRSGVRPMLAAQWLGISRKQFKAWRARSGPIYDQLRETIASARAHLEVKLMTELTRRSPGQALKGLRRQTDDEPEEPTREYHQSGMHTLKKNLPHVLARIADDRVPADTLSPLEVAGREWRQAVITDLGGREHVSTTKLSLVNAALGSWLLLSCVDTYLMELAGSTGVVNRRTRSVFAVVEQRARIADSFVRQLAALGLEKQSAPPMDLNRYIAERYGSNGNMPGDVKETE